jgi:hypothetical protein
MIKNRTKKGVVEGGCPTLTSGGWSSSAHHSRILNNFNFGHIKPRLEYEKSRNYQNYHPIVAPEYK